IKDGELDENSVCAIFAHTAADGKTYNVNMYNLDVILAVGYRTNSAAGKELYPTVEEKAVHLLYFIIKNHPFIDGNKRSAAFSFVWFLKKAGLLEQSKITPPALTALTLFIAESNPKNKDRMVKLVLQLLKK
ncbi:MAG: Fic family protein, partial [Candidatus Aminicenantes bacterium]|nr:Fic family protein [Candidatus Aminicenantes bacterium]